MSAGKHTQGPWRASFTKLTDVVADNGALIAKCERLDGLVNLQANQRLIAAAPDLLSALLDYVAGDCPDAGDIRANRIFAAARAAIAKATGEQQ
jgi:hypothetical protein